MRLRPSNVLVPVTGWAMAAVLAFKIAALVQMAWADDRPGSGQVSAVDPATSTVPTPTTLPPRAAMPASPTRTPTPSSASTADAEETQSGRVVNPAASQSLSASVQAPVASPLPPDWKLLQDLRHQREVLDRRSAALDARETAMDAAQHVLEQRLVEVEHRQAQLASLQSDRQTQEQAGLQGLVKLYEDMRPPEAAAIFDALDLHVLLPLLDKMNERKAAAIMGAMQPERARFATQALAKYRVERAVGPSAAPSNPS